MLRKTKQDCFGWVDILCLKLRLALSPFIWRMTVHMAAVTMSFLVTNIVLSIKSGIELC